MASVPTSTADPALPSCEQTNPSCLGDTVESSAGSGNSRGLRGDRKSEPEHPRPVLVRHKLRVTQLRPGFAETSQTACPPWRKLEGGWGEFGSCVVSSSSSAVSAWGKGANARAQPVPMG